MTNECNCLPLFRKHLEDTAVSVNPEVWIQTDEYEGWIQTDGYEG